MCTHLLAGGPLVCDRTDAHEAPKGCTYTSTSAGDAEPRSDHQ